MQRRDDQVDRDQGELKDLNQALIFIPPAKEYYSVPA